MAGSGTFVEVDEGNVSAGWYDGNQLVISRFDATLQLAENMQVKVDAYLQDMDDLADTFALPSNWSAALGDVVIDPIPEFDFGSAPSFGDIDLPTNWPDPDDYPILGALKPAPEVDLSITEPTEVTEIDPSIDHTDETYTSEMWLAVYNKVLTNIQNGGTGLEASVEQAIYDRAKERQRKENEAQYTKLMNSIGSSGFQMPSGAVVAVQQTMADELLRQAVDINEKIFIAQGELAQKNTHFMIDKSLVMEQLLRDFHNNKQDRSLEAEKAAGSLVVQVYSENVKAYMAKWDGQKAKLEAAVAQIEVVLKENDYTIQSFKAQMDGVVSQVEAVSKHTEGLVEGYKGEVQGFAARVDATATWYGALSEEQKNKVAVAELEVRKAIAEVESEIKGYVSYNDLKRQLATDLANIASQSVASALNAVNASAGYSYSGNESVSESWGHSDNISESHSYEEEA